MAVDKEAPVPSVMNNWDVKELKVVLDDYIHRAEKEVQEQGAPSDAKGGLLVIDSKTG
jgi:hypothetical protein